MPLQPFRLIPEYRDYVWGGDRLRPGHSPTAEAWIVYEGDRIAGASQPGPLDGLTLADAVQRYGAELLGNRPLAMTGERFPLLVKLLDCRDWLSLQVHPDDTQAVALEGPGRFGKTEAWHILDATPGAEILCGFTHPLDLAHLATALYAGRPILEHVACLEVHAGDTLLIHPGTLHALGPGLLVYEVQQTSDITYRIYDWDRPLSAGRKLHLKQSLAVLDPARLPRPAPRPAVLQGRPSRLTASEYFELWLLDGGPVPISLDTRRQSFHVLTAVEGRLSAAGPGWSAGLDRFETLVIPAVCEAYQVTLSAGSYALLAGVP